MIFALARLIRLPNLVIVALTQYLLYFFVFYPNFQDYGIIPRLDFAHFSLLVLVTILLTAGGYVINDVMDMETDQVNKPEKMVINRYLSRRTALWIYYCLQSMGFFMAVYLSFYVNNLKLLSLYPTAAVGLYAYSSYLKRRPLVGHLLISLYCAGVALVVLLAELPGFELLSQKAPDLAGLLLKIILSYSIFAFLTTLLRELIKVMQDEKGDRQAGYCTAAVAWGQERVKGLCIFLGGILSLLLIVNGIYFSQFFSSFWVIVIVSVLALPTVMIIFALSRLEPDPNFKNLSNLTKLLMLLGILALISFA